MTVRELIVFLKSCDPDARIVVETKNELDDAGWNREANVREDKDEHDGEHVVVIS